MLTTKHHVTYRHILLPFLTPLLTVNRHRLPRLPRRQLQQKQQAASLWGFGSWSADTQSKPEKLEEAPAPHLHPPAPPPPQQSFSAGWESTPSLSHSTKEEDIKTTTAPWSVWTGSPRDSSFDPELRPETETFVNYGITDGKVGSQSQSQSPKQPDSLQGSGISGGGRLKVDGTWTDEPHASDSMSLKEWLLAPPSKQEEERPKIATDQETKPEKTTKTKTTRIRRRPRTPKDEAESFGQPREVSMAETEWVGEYLTQMNTTGVSTTGEATAQPAGRPQDVASEKLLMESLVFPVPGEDGLEERKGDLWLNKGMASTAEIPLSRQQAIQGATPPIRGEYEGRTFRKYLARGPGPLPLRKEGEQTDHQAGTETAEPGSTTTSSPPSNKQPANDIKVRRIPPQPRLMYRRPIRERLDPFDLNSTQSSFRNFQKRVDSYAEGIPLLKLVQDQAKKEEPAPSPTPSESASTELAAPELEPILTEVAPTEPMSRLEMLRARLQTGLKLLDEAEAKRREEETQMKTSEQSRRKLEKNVEKALEELNGLLEKQKAATSLTPSEEARPLTSLEVGLIQARSPSETKSLTETSSNDVKVPPEDLKKQRLTLSRRDKKGALKSALWTDDVKEEPVPYSPKNAYEAWKVLETHNIANRTKGRKQGPDYTAPKEIPGFLKTEPKDVFSARMPWQGGSGGAPYMANSDALWNEGDAGADMGLDWDMFNDATSENPDEHFQPGFRSSEGSYFQQGARASDMTGHYDQYVGPNAEQAIGEAVLDYGRYKPGQAGSTNPRDLDASDGFTRTNSWGVQPTGGEAYPAEQHPPQPTQPFVESTLPTIPDWGVEGTPFPTEVSAAVTPFGVSTGNDQPTAPVRHIDVTNPRARGPPRSPPKALKWGRAGNTHRVILVLKRELEKLGEPTVGEPEETATRREKLIQHISSREITLAEQRRLRREAGLSDALPDIHLRAEEGKYIVDHVLDPSTKKLEWDAIQNLNFTVLALEEFLARITPDAEKVKEKGDREKAVVEKKKREEPIDRMRRLLASNASHRKEAIRKQIKMREKAGETVEDLHQEIPPGPFYKRLAEDRVKDIVSKQWNKYFRGEYYPEAVDL